MISDHCPVIMSEFAKNDLEQAALTFFDPKKLAVPATPLTTLPATLAELQRERKLLAREAHRAGGDAYLCKEDSARLDHILYAGHLVEHAGLHLEELQGLSPQQVKFLATFWTQMVDLPQWDAYLAEHDADLVAEIAEFRGEGLRLMDPQGRATMHGREEDETAFFRVLGRLGMYAKNPRMRMICMRWMQCKDSAESTD